MLSETSGWESPDRGALFVVSGPSGCGKSTLLSRVLPEFPDISFSVSATTRAPRPGEINGVHYHFVSHAGFAALREEGALLEYAEVYGNFYGTPRAPVEAALEQGRSILLDIDTQGAAQVRVSMPEVVTLFILPPSLDTLRARLLARGQDAPAVIERRMTEAHAQLSACGSYDYLVMNDDLDQAVLQFRSILVAELSRTWRRTTWTSRFLTPAS